jgi:MFS family permease
MNGKHRSLRALDALAFALPEIQAGLGPFLVLYLSQARHWDAARIGTLLATCGLVGLAAATPLGALVDRARDKRALLAAAVVAVAASCLAMGHASSATAIVAGQTAIALLGGVFGPALAALSLGLVGRQGLERRCGRNAALGAAGSVSWACALGVIGTTAGLAAMFDFVAAAALPALTALGAIRAADVDPRLARGADAAATTARALRPWQVLRGRGVPTLMACAFLFHLANAAVLTLAAQRAAALAHADSPLYVAGLVATNQAVTIPAAWLAGWLAARGPRRPAFAIAFLALPLRCALFMFADRPGALVAVQLLDGLGAGVFGVMQVLVVADLTRGSGWFNFAQGAVATVVGCGAALSNLLAGAVVRTASFEVGFAVLGLIALAALAVFALALPETGMRRAQSAPAIL